jgi:hypothetical protein
MEKRKRKNKEAAEEKIRWKKHTEISNEKTKLARQLNPNTYPMKVQG